MDIELQLIERARSGDKTAFREIVEQHKRGVYYLAFDITGNREDAEDVSQDVFIKVYRSLDKFRGDAKFSTWLYRITVNTCYSMKSKKSITEMNVKENMEEVVDHSDEKIIHAAADPERVTESSFLKKQIEKALDKLSKKERAVFTMRNFQEMSFGEIVEIMKIKSSTVRSLNFRALKKLQKELAYYKSEN